MHNVDALIRKLGKLAKNQLRQMSGLEAAREAATAKAAAVARLSTELDALGELITALEKLPDADKTRMDRIADAVKRRETKTWALTGALTASRDAEKQLAEWATKSAPTKVASELYHFHRTLLLAESAVMQSRGTFRLARLITTAAALLTLLGAVLYATALPGDRDGAAPSGLDKQYTAVTIGVKVNTAAWKQLEKCQQGTDDLSNLSALLTSAEDADAKQDGPFASTVTDSRCPADIQVDNGDGTYRPSG